MFGSRAFRVGVLQALLWAVIGAPLVRICSRFGKIFKDFGTKLSDLTLGLLNFAHFLVAHWYLGVLALVLWPVVNWGVVSILSPSPEVVVPRRLWYCLTSL
ncbi:MAG: hypothetical protein ABSF26_28045 [Thermoguttaceae bacterium]|jgi:type II secretory pathway component PulF